jgi:hypothetical protein
MIEEGQRITDRIWRPLARSTTLRRAVQGRVRGGG